MNAASRGRGMRTVVVAAIGVAVALAGLRAQLTEQQAQQRLAGQQRAVRKLLAHDVLERAWDDQRRAVYRIAAPGAAASLRLAGQGITIYVGGIDPRA